MGRSNLSEREREGEAAAPSRIHECRGEGSYGKSPNRCQLNRASGCALGSSLSFALTHPKPPPSTAPFRFLPAGSIQLALPLGGKRSMGPWAKYQSEDENWKDVADRENDFSRWEF